MYCKYTSRRSNKEISHFELPSEGGPILPIFCVVRRLRTTRVRIAPHALNMGKIGSAQVMIVLILLPYLFYMVKSKQTHD